jgi:hypothetical protein
MSQTHVYFDPNKGDVPFTTDTLLAPLSGCGDATKYLAGDGTLQQIIAPLLFSAARVTLNAANLATINSVPITVVAAPGANKLLVPDFIAIDQRFGTAAYVGTGLDLYLGTTALSMFDNTTLIAVASQIAVVPCSVTIAALARASGVNQPLRLSSSGAYTVGDGIARVVVYYKVVDFGA